MRDLTSVADTVLSEMGEAPEMDAPQPVWIPERLLRPAGFDSVTVIEPLHRFAHEVLPRTFGSKQNRSLLSRLGRRIGYDPRDGRCLFIGRQAAHGSAST